VHANQLLAKRLADVGNAMNMIRMCDAVEDLVVS